MPAGGDQRPPERALLLYELDRQEPVGYLDGDGLPRDMDNKLKRVVKGTFFDRSSVEGWPLVLFAEVPALLHLACGVTLAPMRRASATTGPLTS